MEIPKAINTQDPEVKSFLVELGEIAQQLRGVSIPRILEQWDKIQEMKQENPNYWHVNK